jgi:hypothetical protein
MDDRTVRPVDGTDAQMFIQWKGTTVCLDFDCPCGTHGHLDSDFAYFIGCPKCGAVYEMGTQVLATKCADLTLDDSEVKVLDVHDWQSTSEDS